MLKKIYIEITNVCNLKCKFCPETTRVKKMMTIDEFEHIIRDVRNYTKLVCLHVKGEPLLHNHLEDILKILEKYNLKANITTNGTLIKDKLEVLKKSKAVRQINFSIHSVVQNESMNSKYLNDIFESVEELKDVLISYRLWNVKSIKENDINTNIIRALSKYYNLEELKELLTESSFVKLKENVFINQDTEFTWPDINTETIIENGRCLALKEQIAVLVDGTVVPCCLDNNGDIPLGNIFNDSFQNILENDFCKTIKKNFENRIITCELCKTCGFLKRLEEKRNCC